MRGGGGAVRPSLPFFLPFTQNYHKAPIPENSWPCIPFCCGCPHEKKIKKFCFTPPLRALWKMDQPAMLERVKRCIVQSINFIFCPTVYRLICCFKRRSCSFWTFRPSVRTWSNLHVHQGLLSHLGGTRGTNWYFSPREGAGYSDRLLLYEVIF